LEVATIIAREMTNPRIAAELVITEGTAPNHVKHILARLTFDSRADRHLGDRARPAPRFPLLSGPGSPGPAI
jgi:hypothetical protein